MKRRSMGVGILLGALAGCSGGSGSGGGSGYIPPRWANQQRVPTASHLRAVRFNTPLQGFVAGESTSIFRTDDGGLSWVQEEHTPFARGGDILGFDFLGKELKAVGSANDNGLGRLWSSGNAVNWTTADANGAGAKFVAVDVTPSTTGGTPFLTWALREDWNINVTSAGNAPAEQTTIPKGGLGGNKATCIDLLNAAGYVGGEGGFLWETGDWTGTWTQVTGTGSGHLRDVQILEPGIVFVCGDSATLLFTENGGAVSAVGGKPAITTHFRGLHFFHSFQDKSLGWLVGDGGVVYRVSGTWDTMANSWDWDPWVLVATGTTEPLYDVHFADPTTGYAVGDNGMVVKLVDSGTATTATVLTSGFLDDINAVSFNPTGVVGVAVGDNGRVYKTLNGGLLWTMVRPLGGADTTKWTSVSIPPGNGNVAYICGEGGKVRRNVDLAGGNTWTAPFAAPPNEHYRAIHFPSGADVGFLAGEDSTLLYTNTGTQGTWSWVSIAPADVTHYQALASNVAGGGVDLFAAGTNGVSATQDFGSYALTWGQLTPATSFGGGTIQAVAAPVSSLYFFAVDDGAGQRLFRNLAGLWQSASQPAGPPPTALGLAFAGQSFGWWVSDKIYMTENGADPALNDWVTSPTHTKSTFRGIWMNQTGTVGYVVGTNGAILKTVTGGK